MEYKSAYKKLNRKINTWCIYTQRIDTYGLGCQHECKYCYAKSLLDFRGYWNKIPAISDINKISSSIKRLIPGDTVRIGSMTDCFQPLEKENNITYQTIKWLNYYKIHYLIVTKSNLVSEDKYINIYDKKLAHFQITITHTNDNECFKYEKASLISERIKSIEKLYKLGFDVSIRLSPFIEEFIDYNILNKIKCNKILIEFLKVNHWIKKWFNINYFDYVVKYGGYSHLPLFKKLILLKNITGFKQISIGEYVKDHHNYFKTNINYNSEDCCNLNIKLIIIDKQLTLFDL